MKKESVRNLCGYFTVEAALVMPVVFACYLFVMVILIFFYERCVQEENACRLPVWKEYVEGFLGSDGENRDIFSEQEIAQYLMGCLENEELDRYILSEDLEADILFRGEWMQIRRNTVYPLFGDWEMAAEIWVYSPDPTAYIRSVNFLKNTIMKDEE